MEVKETHQRGREDGNIALDVALVAGIVVAADGDVPLGGFGIGKQTVKEQIFGILAVHGIVAQHKQRVLISRLLLSFMIILS